jgi:DHA2 family multidrug resistance protein
MTFTQLALPMLGYGLGMPLFFVPLMSVSIMTVPPAETATASGLINFLRSMSGGFATAIVTTAWSDEATANRVQLVGRLNRPGAILSKMGGTHSNAALHRLDSMVQSQSVMLATNKIFLLSGLLIACVAAGVWFLPKPKGRPQVVHGH